MLLQAASKSPVAIRYERNYVFNMDGYHAGDIILIVMCNLCIELLKF